MYIPCAHITVLDTEIASQEVNLKGGSIMFSRIISRNEIDIAAADFSITADRMEDFEFTFPVGKGSRKKVFFFSVPAIKALPPPLESSCHSFWGELSSNLFCLS